jgi:RNA-directed DNA polymerase
VNNALVEFMSPDIARVATQLLTTRGHLPTGSPASAFIGNLVLQQLDRDLQNIAQRTGLIYTRYVDDLTFSSKKNFANTEIPRLVLEAVKKSGFIHKAQKTQYQIGPTLITGVLLDRLRLKLPKPYLQLIEAELQRGENPNRIQGMLAHAASIAASNRRYQQSANA